MCVEAFNKSTRKPVQCGTCQFTVCMQCFEHYQMEHSGMYDVQCMSCKQLWEDEYVRERVPMSVIKRLTEATKKRLRDEEIAFMPETQLYVEYGRAVNTVKVNEYLDVMREVHEFEYQIARDELSSTIKMGERQARKSALRQSIEQRKSYLWKLKNRIQAWRASKHLSIHFKDIMPEPLYEKHFANATTAGEAESSHHGRRGSVEPLVLCPCPAEQCRGFVTRKGHKCGVCQQEVCAKCLTMVVDSETPHECQETDVQSAELILKSSKPCPKCATRIHKIDGCDQMWCTQCNTPFSWQSGQEIVGAVIHNPHYYEWMRNRNHTTEAVDRYQMNHCEGLPDIHTLMLHTDFVFGRNNMRFTDQIRRIHRRCVHFREVEIRGRIPRNQDPNLQFRDNLDIRLKWLNQETTDKSFESVLHKRYKQKLVNQRTVQVYDLVITLCSDVFHRLLRTNEDTEAIRNEYLNELREIFSYADSCFKKLEKVYKMSMPIVS